MLEKDFKCNLDPVAALNIRVAETESLPMDKMVVSDILKFLKMVVMSRDALAHGLEEGGADSEHHISRGL